LAYGQRDPYDDQGKDRQHTLISRNNQERRRSADNYGLAELGSVILLFFD